MSNGELRHAEDVVQPLGLPGVELLQRTAAATTTAGAAEATTATTATTTVTATSAVKAAATATATAKVTTAATHTEDIGGNVNEGTGTDKGRIGSVKLSGQLGVCMRGVIDKRHGEAAYLHGGKTRLGPTEGPWHQLSSDSTEAVKLNLLHEAVVNDTTVGQGHGAGYTVSFDLYRAAARQAQTNLPVPKKRLPWAPTFLNWSLAF